MSSLKDLVSRLLNPRSRLDQVPSLTSAVQNGFDESQAPAYAGRRLNLRAVLQNGPFMLGLLIVLALFALVLFGPVWAPQNPYIAGQHIVPHFDREANEFIRPPLEPSPEYPFGTDQWGTDILSMLMHGARNTLVACAFITMLRVLLGLSLGAVAGWNEGKTSDRLIMGMVGIMTSLPVLISTIILIYALDIRRGLAVFIIALSVVGWAEIAQYIRSEFLILRKLPFIEGARATGLTGIQIAVRHILPNVLPQLLIITFLEMGAVLMLLGELGFVGVYIGGGSRIDLTEPLDPTQIFTLADVPEWGSMIANGFRWLRSKPFVVFPPAFAFFIAVVGFNALGEGLRRLVERQAINTAFLLQRRMLLVVVALTMATAFIMSNTGAAPWFARVARSFNSEQVYDHIAALTAMEGRGIGQPGGDEAVAYIAEQFEAYGLEPGWRQSSYFYILETRLVRPVEQPVLTLLDAGGRQVDAYQHQIDFGFVIDGHGGSGRAEAQVTFVGFRSNRPDMSWDSYQGLDLRGRIALIIEENAPADFATEAMVRGAAGVLMVSGDGRDDVRSQIQLADPERDYLRKPNIPIFRIRPQVAQALVGQDGRSLAELFTAVPSQNDAVWFTHDLSGQAHMELLLSEPEAIEVPSVIGYRPGSDLDLGNELVVLFATYDGLGMDPDGTVYPAANHNASGVSMLLELARLWQEESLDTRRTTMFVAWGGGQLDYSGAEEWLEDPFNFRHVRTQSIRSNISPAILLQLDYVGGGGSVLAVQSASRRNLDELIADSSTEVGLPLFDEDVPGLFSEDIVSDEMASWAIFSWANADVSPHQDTLETIDKEKLQSFGQMFALLLTKLVRENTF